MKQRILSILMTLCLCLTLLPTVALAATGTKLTQDNISSYTPLTGGSYYLGGDITLSSTLTVTGTVTLDLNGNTLTGATGSTDTFGNCGNGGTAITVQSGGALTIKDTSTGSTNGSIVGGNGCGAEDSAGSHGGNGGTAITVEEDGSLTVSGGTIKGGNGGIGSTFGGNGGGGGAAIAVNSGSLTVSGGSIVGGNGNGRDSGVVEGNGGSGGSGIEITHGTVNIDGSGTINGGNGSNGSASTSRGGSGGAGGNGLLVTDGNVTITGSGTINGGNAGNGGGCGAYGDPGFGGSGGNGLLIEGGTVTVGGSGTIKDGTAGTGGSDTTGSTSGSNGTPGKAIACSDEYSDSIEVSSAAALKTAVDAGASKIKLTGDIIGCESSLICKDVELTLDLNGHVLSFANSKKLQLEETSAAPNTTVTLIDGDPTATHTDTTLPNGGVVDGDVLLTRGSDKVENLVTLHANGGTVTGKVTLCKTGVIDCTNGTPTAFTGSVADRDAANQSAGSLQGGIFYGELKEQYLTQPSANVTGTTITFMNGNARYAFEVVGNGKTSVAPIAPTPAAGYTFGGWYEKDANGAFKDTAFNFGTTIANNTNNITLYAVWTPNTDTKYTVAYSYQDVDGRNYTQDTTLTQEKTGTTDAAIALDSLKAYGEKTGFAFEKFDPATATIAGDGSTVVKLYYARNQYTLTFKNGVDETPISSGMVYYGAAITAPADPERTGYTFDGWDGIVPGTMPANALTLTAQWTRDTYTISYELNGGTNSSANPATYTIEDDDITLEAPTRAGYRFLGWTYGTVTEPAQTVTIPAGSHGSLTFTANWQFIPVVSLPVGNVNVSNALNGSVSANHDTARQGSIVTVTVDPANGSALDSLSVTDANGNAIPVTHVSGNKYSFVMPATDVTVRASFTDGTSTGFVDVPADKYFYNAVNWAVANGITSGTDATHFSPYASCTRGQLVTFLWRAAGCPAAKATENAFGDVKETSGFYKAILWAAENGIVTGYDDGTFQPNKAISRQQTAAILYRYAKYAGMDVSVGEDTNILSFNDATSVSEYAVSAFQWATGAQVITGNGANLLPHDTCTRAQIVTMLYRLLAK